ncbi:MAG: tyrosine--tRNA ligase, partial [Acetobacter sp.]|nr:tyrosine--tRNA ligase [Acetobacter sp.]
MTKTLFRSPFMQEASARGFVYQCTHAEELDALMCQGPITAYIGFDPTADCLHVGSLIQIMILRLLQRHGHKVIALIGGGTAKIGDPSFREESRQLMTEERIQTNQTGIEACLRQFLSFNTHDVRLVNNADWLDHLMYIDVLRDVGIHFSVNRMLSFDSVRSRLDREQGLTFLEFNYSILQAYDFRELSRRYGVCLQLGGSDQWGNIVSGVELIRR